MFQTLRELFYAIHEFIDELLGIEEESIV